MTDVKPTAEALIAAIPALSPYARTATLLRPAAGVPSVHGSHVGGPLLWPVDEEWPVCEGPHLVSVAEKLSDADRETWQQIDRDMRARRAGKPHSAYEVTAEEAAIQSLIMDGAGCLDMVAWARIRQVPVTAVPGIPMVGVLQLRAQDVPGADWPEGSDVLQVLWCPREHAEQPGQSFYWGPAVALRHRSAATVTAVLEAPAPVDAVDSYLPQPCVLDPVEVTDLPHTEELPEALAEEAEEWAERHDTEYHRDIACRDGWKAGGWPSWHLTDLTPVDCSCGATARVFLTMDSGGDPGLSVGRFGELRVFTCPVDGAHPIRLNIQ
uniref:DUF1963 domain-containing protein n=1 Tax=Streptomyces sp. NBC_00049 TaxID=2903617 RepID=A0AAU2JIQ8_9ACTN